VNAPDGTVAGQGKCPHCGAKVDLATAERVGLQPGEVLGGCRIEGLVGRGGMAAVYRATQLSLDRPVALKVLSERLARRASFVERFDREATALAQLSHANIVNILDKGEEGGTYFFVMEFVEGESLRARLAREAKLGFAAALALFDQVAAGLEYAHARDVLHRDIKPESILITPAGEAKLADFGIARIAGDDTPVQRRLTAADTRMGTAHYMAPEQMRDAASVDHRADLYALGVTLYEMLTGELPIGQFKRASHLAPGIPAAVDSVISRALAALSDERFQSVAEFRASLHAAARGGATHAHHAPRRPTRRSWRPATIAAAAALLAIAAAALAFFAAGSRRHEPPPQAEPPPQKPTEAELREAKAGELLALAYRAVALKKWAEAKVLLAELQKDFGSAPFVVARSGEIAELHKEVAGTLQPKEPPKAEEVLKPKAEPEPKAEPPPPPKEKAEPPPKPEPEPKEKPKQGPPPEPKQLVLFDGTSLEGWKVIELGPGPRRGEGVHLANGQAALDGGKHGAGIAWTRPTPTDSYELALEAMRTEGRTPLAYVVFPVGGTACSLVLGPPNLSGLETLDGQPLRHDLPLDNDRWHKIAIRVTPARIAVLLDQNPVLETPRAGHAFAVPSFCQDYQPIGIVALRTTVALRSVRIRRLTIAPPRIIKADPSPGEQLVTRVKALWAKRAYAPALEAAQAGLAGAPDDAARNSAQAIVRAAELLPRIWAVADAGAEALKGKTFTCRGVSGKIVGVKNDCLQLASGVGQSLPRLATLDTAELLALAKGALPTARPDDHLAVALFAAFDEARDPALARKALAAAKAAGADPADVADLIALAALPTFRKAIAAARLELDAARYPAARKAIAEVQRLRPDGSDAARVIESTLQATLAQAVAACKAADFAKANETLALADALDPKHPDAEKLQAWLKANIRPALVETFDTVRLDRWEIASGVWRSK